MGAHVLLPDAPVTDFDYQAWAVAAAHPELQPRPEDFVHLEDARTVLLERAHHANLELPAFPAVAAKILNLIESPECDMRALIKTIRLDAVVSAQVLRVANSMAFSRGVQLTTVQEAAVRLGFKAIGNIAVAAATMSLLQEHERDIHDCFRERWASLAHTFPRVAASSRWLSKAFSRGNPEEAYLAGLMHDLGKVVALELCGEMVQDGDLAADLHPGVLERLIDDTHVELGTLLMKEWGVRVHETPRAEPAGREGARPAARRAHRFCARRGPHEPVGLALTEGRAAVERAGPGAEARAVSGRR